MNWKDYEKEIYSIFRDEYPTSEITHNVHRDGRYSKVKRQIDILIEDYVAGNRMTIVVDGKYFNEKIDVKGVESFIGMLEDIGAHKGLLISQKGFSQAAKNRAHYGPSEIELDVLNFEDLKAYQSHGAIPYAGSNGVFLPAPFGWVIDIQTTPAWLATIYEQGLTLDEAMKANEYMYVQFWDRKKDNENLDDLLKIQEGFLKEADPNTTFSYPATIKRDDARTALRIAKLDNYPKPEYTGLVEFDEFIFFCVMFTPDESKNKNIRKLENIMANIKPIKIE